MKARKRKAEKHRDSFDAKRRKTERRGKGPLIPPDNSNVELIATTSYYGIGAKVGKGKCITLPVSRQNGRRVNAPKRLTNNERACTSNGPQTDIPKRSLNIPTPGYRLVSTSDAENVENDKSNSETDNRETDNKSGNKSDTEADNKSDTEADNKSDTEADNKSDTDSDSPPNRCSSEFEDTNNEERVRRAINNRVIRGSGKAVYKGILTRGKASLNRRRGDLNRDKGCSCDILVVEFDRGWRETGAYVELKYRQKGWSLCVVHQGEDLFLQEIRNRFFIYTTNKYTGAHMWRGDKGWMLEFKTYSQLNAFKKLHEMCFQRNFKANASRQVPTPKFRFVKDLDTRWRGPAFIRPANGYITGVDMDMDSRVLYDMDSEDEQWLNSVNGKAGTYKQKISEHKFEKMIYNLEKYSYDRDELLSEEAALEVCLHVASLKIIKLIHAYWIKKRLKKGMSLVRHFQPEHWKRHSTERHIVEKDVTNSEETPHFGGIDAPISKEITNSGGLENPESPVDKEIPSTGGISNMDSPSLPEVCDEPQTVTQQAESRRKEKQQAPPQAELVWRKFTGRANAEELKKLKIMTQLRDSGIKHFSRRLKIPTMTSNGSSNDDTVSPSGQDAGELYALADAAMMKDLNDGRKSSDEEAESEIEIVEAQGGDIPPATRSQTLRVHRERQKLKEQMAKLREQMKKSAPQLPVKSKDNDSVDKFTADIMKKINDNRRSKRLLAKTKSQRGAKAQRFKTLLLVVANSTGVKSRSKMYKY